MSLNIYVVNKVYLYIKSHHKHIIIYEYIIVYIVHLKDIWQIEGI